MTARRPARPRARAVVRPRRASCSPSATAQLLAFVWMKVHAAGEHGRRAGRRDLRRSASTRTRRASGSGGALDPASALDAPAPAARLRARRAVHRGATNAVAVRTYTRAGFVRGRPSDVHPLTRPVPMADEPPRSAGAHAARCARCARCTESTSTTEPSPVDRDRPPRPTSAEAPSTTTAVPGSRPQPELAAHIAEHIADEAPRRSRRRPRTSRCPTTGSSTASCRWLAFNERVLELAEDPDAAAARARAVPGDLRLEPRRVLHGPGRRPQAAHRDRPRRHRRVGPDARARCSRRISERAHELMDRHATVLHRAGAARARRRGHHARALGRARRGRAGAAAQVLPQADLPGAHAARRRPGAPVPVHLRALAQPRRRRASTRRPARSTSRASRCRRCCRGSSRSTRAGRPSAPSTQTAGRRRRARRRSCPLEDVIAEHLDYLFPGMEVVEHHTFRVTRNEDVEVEEDDAENLLKAMEKELLRRRFGPPVRLEVADGISAAHPRAAGARARRRRGRGLRRSPRRSTSRASTSSPTSTARTCSTRAFVPTTHRHLAEVESATPTDIFAAIRARDILLHHPYDSFSTSVQTFLAQAAADPHGARDQADAVPDVGRLPHRRRPHRRGRGRQAGARARRDQGAVRRAGQHLVGPQARAGRRARGLRHRRPQDALQAARSWCARRRTGCAATATSAPATTTRRPRGCTRTSGLLTARPRGRPGPHAAVQPALRLRAQVAVPPAARRAALGARRARSSASTARPRPPARASRRGSRSRSTRWSTRPPSTRCTARRRRACRSTSSSAASARCARACPGCRETIRVRSILGRFLEHSRIFAFAHTARGAGLDARAPRCSSARPTSCTATSTAASRRSCAIADPDQVAELVELIDESMDDAHRRRGTSAPTARGPGTTRAGRRAADATSRPSLIAAAAATAGAPATGEHGEHGDRARRRGGRRARVARAPGRAPGRARAPPPVQRLVVAQGQARPGRDAPRRPRSARSPRRRARRRARRAAARAASTGSPTAASSACTTGRRRSPAGPTPPRCAPARRCRARRRDEIDAGALVRRRTTAARAADARGRPRARSTRSSRRTPRAGCDTRALVVARHGQARDAQQRGTAASTTAR